MSGAIFLEAEHDLRAHRQFKIKKIALFSRYLDFTLYPSSNKFCTKVRFRVAASILNIEDFALNRVTKSFP